MSFTTVFLLAATLHFYIGMRLVPALDAPVAGIALALLLAASAVLTPLGLLARRWLRPPVADRLTWAGMLCMGMFSSLLVLTLLRDVVLLAGWGLGLPEQPLGRASAVVVALLALAATVIGL